LSNLYIFFAFILAASTLQQLNNVYVGNRVVNLEAAILDQENALPDYTAGLLGLSFLATLGNDQHSYRGDEN
jgi:predicted aspartyl protease